MKSFAPDPRTFEGLSRELWLVVDPQSMVLWLDERARNALRVSPGARLLDACAAGTEDALDRLVRQAIDGRRDGTTEITLTIAGKPVVVACRAQLIEEGKIAIVASLVAEDHAQALVQVSTMLSEMAQLHHETDRQQRELLRRHEELVRVHRELDDTSKGVMALHAELGEKDDSIRRVSEVRSRLVTNVSHELRTPINSILGLTKLLLARTDGELTEEQEKQLRFVRQSAESLYTLVDDLLDLSKIDAGRALVRTQALDVGVLFASLRGMLRPLADAAPNVTLAFDTPAEPIALETDETKLAQILRNLVTNALKFTERGSVRITARSDGDDAVFEVTDTGIGIARDDHERIFEEFFQVDGAVQRRSKGTGLGLTLSRHLAELLHGSLSLESEIGKGSTFTLRIPRRHPEAAELAALVERSALATPDHQPVLVVEDDKQTLFLYEKYLRGSGFNVIPARSIDEARAALEKIRPAAIVLDVMLEGETSWRFLADLKADARTRDIPTLVVTVTNREEKARALGADEFNMKPLDKEWLVAKLRTMARGHAVERILVIDDDRVARYLVRKHLEGTPYEVLEAAGGIEGVRLARDRAPDVIFLDFALPEMSAFDVLDELKKDPTTRKIPVIIHTAKSLATDERERLEREASSILHKQSLSREVAIGRIREALEKAGIRPERGDVGAAR